MDDLKDSVAATVRLVHGLTKAAADVGNGTRSIGGGLGGRDGLKVRIGAPDANLSNGRPGSSASSPRQQLSSVGYTNR